MRSGQISGSGHSIMLKRENRLLRYAGNIHISREEAPLKTSERARIPRTVPAILAVLILIAAVAAGNAAAQTGPATPMNPATSPVLPEIAGHTMSRTDDRSFDSPAQARAPTDESALPGRSYTNTAPADEEPQGICGRNQAVQDSVLAELPNVNQCSGVTGEHLRGLSGTLDISGQGITALSAADFQGMSGITGMDASGNQLAHVPGDLLQQLRHQSHTHSTTETTRNGYVIAVIDKSGSMSGQLSAAKSGARWLAANRPTDMPMAVMAFSDTARTAQDFTTETGLLNNAINSLSSQGGTNIDGALARAYSQAGSRPRHIAARRHHRVQRRRVHPVRQPSRHHVHQLRRRRQGQRDLDVRPECQNGRPGRPRRRGVQHPAQLLAKRFLFPSRDNQRDHHHDKQPRAVHNLARPVRQLPHIIARRDLRPSCQP